MASATITKDVSRISAETHDRPTLFLGGEWVRAQGGGAFQVVNPSTGTHLATLPCPSDDQVSDAIAAAEAAFPRFRATPPADRAALLMRIAVAVRESAEEIARAIALEIGKPLAQARGEVAGLAAGFDWFAGEAVRIEGAILPPAGPGAQSLVELEPVGVAALMTPWNFPVALLGRKLAPALAAGCTVVAKPAEEAPLSAMLFAGCLVEAGVPEGVFNLLLGRPEPISRIIMASGTVRKVSFTGSVRVGRMVAAAAAPTLKRVSLELGGNAPVIVAPDADAEAAGRLAAQRKAANAGQICVAPNRFYVHESDRDAFAAGFAAAAGDIRIGEALDETTQMGPLATERQRDRMDHLVETASRAGAEIVVGGSRPRDRNAGYYFEPTLVAGATDDMEVMADEIFGPIAPLATFADLDEAIARANETDMGLSAFAFTRDAVTAARLREGLKAGMIGINTMAFGRPDAPFGGIGASGYGREGGRWALNEYLQTKWTEQVFQGA
jgi:succinate-semialdehyde dehydrogenase/glutarate-semialdehyde dehydrogenase